jgi:Ca2+-binding RTX toxin-like protein
MSEDFTSLSSSRIDGSGGAGLTFTRFERMDAAFGSGDDSVRGTSGNDILRGNAGEDSLGGLGGRDSLYGGADKDWLVGGSGDDHLSGGSGADQMFGGSGNDLYIVGNAADQVFESSGEGTDEVESFVTFSIEGTQIERIDLTGSSNIDAVGNGKGNRVEGNSGANTLTGLEGRDDIRLGNDAAADRVFIRADSDSKGFQRDVLRDFDANAEDKVALQVDPSFDGLFFQTKSGGRLDKDSFNADIAAALNSTLKSGNLNQAILWDPSSGDRNEPGHRYLVIDANNDGSYTSGADVVIEFDNLKGTLGTSDFELSTIL